MINIGFVLFKSISDAKIETKRIKSFLFWLVKFQSSISSLIFNVWACIGLEIKIELKFNQLEERKPNSANFALIG